MPTVRLFSTETASIKIKKNARHECIRCCRVVGACVVCTVCCKHDKQQHAPLREALLCLYFDQKEVLPLSIQLNSLYTIHSLTHFETIDYEH